MAPKRQHAQISQNPTDTANNPFAFCESWPGRALWRSTGPGKGDPRRSQTLISSHQLFICPDLLTSGQFFLERPKHSTITVLGKARRTRNTKEKLRSSVLDCFSSDSSSPLPTFYVNSFIARWSWGKFCLVHALRCSCSHDTNKPLEACSLCEGSGLSLFTQRSHPSI